MAFSTILVTISLFSFGYSTVFFKEEFNDGWRDRWVDSTHKGDEQGVWKHTHGKYYGDKEKDMGLQTSQDARFYGISAAFPEKFSNKDKTLVVQFQVKHEQNIDCGGGYVKVFPSTLNQADMHGDSPYAIMFGPDICGYATKKVHVIFNYKEKNLLTKKDIKCKDDELSHVYTLIVKSDNTYEVLIDGEKSESGELSDDWDFLEPKRIKDPEAKKPDDWEDNEKIDDPEDVKPADWDSVPQYIADPDAKKPDDWDDEMDGEWEAAQIDNPDYKGEWKAKQIDNPKYKGPWIHPEIDNPDYVEDPNLYLYEDLGAIGLDLWQVKSGSVFDNIFVGDDVTEAATFRDETWGSTKDGEKEMKEAADKVKREEEEAAAKKAEEESKAKGGDDDEEPEEDVPDEDMDLDEDKAEKDEL